MGIYRSLIKLAMLVLVVSAAIVGVYSYHQQHSADADFQREHQRTLQLEQIVQRLGTERRVADVIVTDQQTIDGILRTTILFVEYGPDGTSLPAKRFTIDGNIIHLDAMVVKFDGKFVEDNDPLRGRSIALFTRLYGDSQKPSNAFPIDEPGEIPQVYKDADPNVSRFEHALWTNFWRLADEANYREAMGVRVAQGEGIWRPFEPGRLYTITLECNGGLNIRSEPIKGIYQEALKAVSSAR